jgi:hypothetical protein
MEGHAQMHVVTFADDVQPSRSSKKEACWQAALNKMAATLSHLRLQQDAPWKGRDSSQMSGACGLVVWCR